MNKKKLIIILLGPPGSGKGTQAKQLSKHFNLPHISTGDLLRSEIANETPIGLQAKAFIEKGHLVPDDVVMKMLFDRISQPDCTHGYLLDGFPRTVAQAESLLTHWTVDDSIAILSLDVSDEQIIERITGRLVCRQCGAIFHQKHSPSKLNALCDQCKTGTLYQRLDDQEAVVRERLVVYRKQTEPLIDFYEKKGMLTCFDGSIPSDALFAKIKVHLSCETKSR